MNGGKKEPNLLPTLEEASKTAEERGELVNVKTIKAGLQETEEEVLTEGDVLKGANSLFRQTHTTASEAGDDETKNKVESFKNNLAFLGSSELEKASRGIASDLVGLAENNKYVYIYDSEQGSNSFAAKLVDQQVRDLLQDRPDLKERVKVIRGRRDFVLKTAGNPNAIVVLPDTFSLTRYRITEQATVINAEGLYSDLSKRRLGKERPGDKIYEVYFASDKESSKDKPWKTLSYYEVAPDATIFGSITTPDYETGITEFTTYMGEQGVSSQAPIPATPYQQAPIPAHARPTPESERQKKAGMAKEMAGKAGSAIGKTLGSSIPVVGNAIGGFLGGKVGKILSDPIGLLKRTAQVVGGVILATGALLISFVTTAIAQASIGLLVFVFFVIFVLFVINSGAYIVPPGGFTYGYGVYGPGGPGPISYTGTCPIPGGSITCGSLPFPNSCHGTNDYWSWQQSNCRWAIPVMAGARCYHNSIPGNVCYQTSANCPEYGWATDVAYSGRTCGPSARAYFPSLNGQVLNWTRVRGGRACGEYATYTATDGTNVYDIYFVHMDGLVGGGRSGEPLGYLTCDSCVSPHAHFELRINGSSVDPDYLCE